jgi:nucleoside-diphosphate-sugar epimerase
MGNIAITGAGGYIGERLIAHLDSQEGCGRILGTDISRPEVATEKLTFLKKDIRDHGLIDFWKGEDVESLVHLAFIVDPIRDEKEMYDVNVSLPSSTEETRTCSLSTKTMLLNSFPL